MSYIIASPVHSMLTRTASACSMQAWHRVNSGSCFSHMFLRPATHTSLGVADFANTQLHALTPQHVTSFTSSIADGRMERSNKWENGRREKGDSG